eukprot:4556354-Prymnesium_polylepis.1
MRTSQQRANGRTERAVQANIRVLADAAVAEADAVAGAGAGAARREGLQRHKGRARERQEQRDEGRHRQQHLVKGIRLPNSCSQIGSSFDLLIPGMLLPRRKTLLT